MIDRGIVSEENLAAVRRRGGQYLVVAPHCQMKRFEQEFFKDDWVQVGPEIEVKQVSIPGGEKTYILCRTAGRKVKEQAIREHFTARMERALPALKQMIARRPAERPQRWSANRSPILRD